MDIVSHEQTQRWGFIGTVVWGLLIAAAFVLSQVFAMMVYIGYQYGDVAEHEIGQLMLDLQYNGTVVAISTIASLLVGSLLIFGVIKLKKQSVITHYLGWRMANSAEFKRWFLLLIALLVLSDLLTWSLDKAVVPPFMDMVYSTADPLWLLWIGIVVAAPLFEELFFRGFLLPGLSSSFVGPITAIIITSALWAVIHVQYELYYILTIFVFGLVLGFARLKTGSVVLTIAMHSFVNLAAMIQTVIVLS